MSLDDIDRELEKVGSELKKLSDDVEHRRFRARHVVYSLAVIFLAISVFSIIYYGASVTGFVTFSESVISSEQIGRSFSSSETLSLASGIDNIDSVLLSGKVEGEGRVAVFVETPVGRKLAYFFEGDAGAGIQFTDMCFESCYLYEPIDQVVLDIEIDGAKLHLDSASYMAGRIIDFDLQPYETVIDYSKTRAAVLPLRLTNSEHADYSVVLMLDGPLADRFRWQGSVIHMDSNTSEKTIPVTLTLPSNLGEGTYSHKITARYVPTGNYEFSGSAPVAEAYVKIVN